MAGMNTKTKKKSTNKKTSSTGPKKRITKKKSAKKTKVECFVMIPFKSPFDIYYESIYKPAIKSTELEPIRADDLFRPSVIVSDLWDMIQRAKVLLAELTTKNPNVFYELGLAHAIGKPVILVSETMDDVPFDLQQLRVILYDKNDPMWGEKLGKNITASIKETLDSPVEAVPNIFRKKVKSQAPEQDATIARIETLEKEMRMLRTKSQSTTSESISKIEIAKIELSLVTNTMEFENWIKRWRRIGVPRYELLALINLSNVSHDVFAIADELISKY